MSDKINYEFELIMPVYNEAKTIEKTILKYWEFIKHYPNAKLIIAEDGSKDGTKKILNRLQKKIPFKLESSNLRKGYTKAVIDALKLASKDFILFSDSDGQHDPDDFKKLIQYYPEYDLVIGKKSPRNDPFYRNFISGMYNLLINILFLTNFKDIDSGFRLIKRELIKDVLPKTGNFKYCYFSEFTIFSKKMGYKVKEVPVRHFARNSGQSTIFLPSRLPSIALQLFMQLLILRKNLL